jgi:hypothetical protein
MSSVLLAAESLAKRLANRERYPTAHRIGLIEMDGSLRDVDSRQALAGNQSRETLT